MASFMTILYFLYTPYPMATHAPPCTYTERHKRKNLSLAVSVPEVHYEAINHPPTPADTTAGVGCCSDKLAWIKCQD